MKITTFTAAAILIALSGLAHADEPGAGWPPERREYAPAPRQQQPYDEGYYGRFDGPVPSEVEGDEEIYRRRTTTVIPGGPVAPGVIGAPAIAGPPIGHGPQGILPPFGPELSAGLGCRIDQSRISPDLVQLTVLYRGQQPFGQLVSVGFRGENLRRQVYQLKRLGFCYNLPN